MNDVDLVHALSSIGWPGAVVIVAIAAAFAYVLGQIFKAMGGS